MKKICQFAWLVALLGFIPLTSRAQDSVDVTFRYNITGQTGLSVPGEFNGWNNTAWPMTYLGGDLWVRNARLRIGGNPTPPPQGIPGAWQYKFYYSGASPWPNDPLNHHVNTLDNDNSFIYVKDPTIYHFLPNQRTGFVTTEFPTISAYIFPKVGTVVDTASLALSIDGVLYDNLGSYYDFTSRQLIFTAFTALGNGGHTMILYAGANSDTVTFVTQIGGPPIAPLPGYARHGVTLPGTASNDSTTFRLRVGGTNAVLLRVAPAGQPVASANPHFMRKDPASDNWWINLDLPPGTYEYLYQTGSGAQIYDPWGRHNGQYGSRFTIGPEGLTADDYLWQSNDYERPPLNRLAIYELHVGEFGGGYYGLPAGTAGFAELTTLLPYFDYLGVNAIELMPINDFGQVGASGHSWGYDINSYFALEPGYGTPQEFKILVDSAHARGIAVIVDVVFNHMNDTGPLWQMHPDEVANPYFKLNNDLRFNEDPLFFFKDMDHWTDETQELVFEALKMWIEEYRVDGFRYDFTQGIGWNVNEPTRGILGWANRVEQEYNGTVYQIAEHLPESPALVFYSGLTGGWHDSYRDEIFDEARFKNTSLVDFENLILDLRAYSGNDVPAFPNIYANRTEPVNANVNHDEQSLIYEMVTFQGVPAPEAVLRDKLYATFMFASLGIPMLWQGMEFAEPRGWMNDNEKLSYRPVQFGRLQTAEGQDHYAYYRPLIRQRLQNPALYQGALRKLFRYTSQKVLVWGMEDTTSTHKVMAVANLSWVEQTITDVPWLAAGDWHNVFDQTVFTVNSTPVPGITLPAYTALVYANAPDSVILNVEPLAAQAPGEFSLRQNFPNPFNPETTIEFETPVREQVRLEIYNILGQRVRTLANEVYAPGRYRVVWNGRDEAGEPVASGIYILHFRAGNFVKNQRMVLLR